MLFPVDGALLLGPGELWHGPHRAADIELLLILMDERLVGNSLKGRGSPYAELVYVGHCTHSLNVASLR